MFGKEYGYSFWILALAIMVDCFFLEAWIVMLLWNAIVVSIFALPTIGFWTSCGIMLLCNILFKSGSAAVSSLKK